MYSYPTKFRHRMLAFTKAGKMGALRATRSVQITSSGIENEIVPKVQCLRPHIRP